MSGSTSGVLVGGFKPEDIQRNYLERKRREELQAQQERNATGKGARAGVNPPSPVGNQPIWRAPLTLHASSLDNFQMEDCGGFYRMSIMARSLLPGSPRVGYEFSKELLYHGVHMNEREWLKANTTCNNPPPTKGFEFLIGFQAQPAGMYLDIFSLLYQYRDHPEFSSIIETARAGLERILNRTLIFTTSTLTYEDGRTMVTRHHPQETCPSLVFPVANGRLNEDPKTRTTPSARDMPNGVLTSALFGMPPSWINEVTNWLCGRDTGVKGFSGPGDFVPEEIYIALGGAGRKSPYFQIVAGKELTLPAIGARFYQPENINAGSEQGTGATAKYGHKSVKLGRGTIKVRKAVKVKGGRLT